MERNMRTRILVSPSLMAPIAGDGLPTGYPPCYDCDGGFGCGAWDLPPIPECLSPVDRIPKLEAIHDDNQSCFPEFHHLSDVRSLQPAPKPSEGSLDPSYFINPSHKRFRSPPRVPSPHMQPQPEMNFGLNLSSRTKVVPRSDLARRRRKRISDRTRILEGLMPWEKKMDTGTMLLEAHKYVRFLEAQVTALQTMPVSASGFIPGPVQSGSAGGLEALNRQQLLHVLVNSAPVQDILYKKGFCVFSAEQVVVLRQAVQRHPHVLLLLSSSQ